MNQDADLNARIAQPLARWILETKGEAALASMTNAAGLQPLDLDGRSRWISLEQLESILSHARAHCTDDAEFRRACAYKLLESYGAMRFMLWATSPQRVFEMAAKTMHLVSTVSRCEVLESHRNVFVGRYVSSKPEGRLVCLSRQAQMAAMPTIWGLPPARLIEQGCQANGDGACVYRLEWLESRRWMPSALGLAIGAAPLVALHPGNAAALGLACLPVIGALLGYVYELRRTSRKNLDTSGQLNEALAEVIRDDGEARRELLDLHQRQREWVRVIEEQVGERTQTLQDVVDRVKQLQANRTSTLLGFSHDLRNPLFTLRASADFLEGLELEDEDARHAVDDLLGAIEQTETLMRELMTVARSDTALVRVTPQELDVVPLVDRLRRRLRALVHGREIRVSVFSTREAPDHIETDPLIFDRVIDNLLTNAAKYTERGSIVVEIGGIPGFLSLKVSDTGRGMAHETIERIFHPGGSDKSTRAPESYGVGLSVVVRLLAQVGGKLDVMSKPGSGTTFWVHLPVALPDPAKQPQPTVISDASARLVERVVTIRRVESA
ncbi:MAG: HAMP domain-containing histidine kinase [Myxococcales bacterium]|nr:HAMP domain-containing histidine kinase [Myxococcales bacterium]